jgi:hypothetical protein
MKFSRSSHASSSSELIDDAVAEKLLMSPDILL